MTPGTELIPADVDARVEEVERQVAQARAQAEAMQVRNPEEADIAAAVLRQIKARRSAAEKERKELKGPILEAGRRIDRKFNEAMAPFDPVDEIVREKLGVYQAEKERIRAEEEARLEAERQERERKAQEAREKQEAEARAARVQAQNEAAEAEQLRQQAKDEADREAAEALAEEAAQKAAEAQTAESAIASLPEVSLPSAVVPAAPKPDGISTRKVPKATITNREAVPRKYWVLDEKAINADVRAGVRDIPGVLIEMVDQMAVRG